MKLFKLISLATLLFVLVNFNTQYINASSAIDEEIRIYAEKDGLEQFKKLLLEDPVGYGYEDAEEVNQVTLGPGFELYFIDWEKINESDKSLLEISKPSGKYEFVVESKGKAKSFLTVEKYNGDFRVVMAGGDATKIGESLNTLNNSLSANQVSTDNIVLIKDREIRYLVTNVGGKEMNIPDVNPEQKTLMGNMDNNQLWDSEKTIDFLKEVQSNIENPDADGSIGYPTIQLEKSKGDYYSIVATSLIVATAVTSVSLLLFRKKLKK